MYTVYTGEHVRLRPFASADELISCGVENQRGSFVHWGPNPLLVADDRRKFEEHGMLPMPGCGQFAIELLDGELAGVSHYATNRAGMVAAVGTFVRDHLRHRRIGVEARRLCLCFLFDNLQVVKVEAITLSNNIAAITSLERCGMTREGLKHGMRFSQGRWASFVFYAMFREQWEQMDYRHAVQRGAQ